MLLRPRALERGFEWDAFVRSTKTGVARSRSASVPRVCPRSLDVDDAALLVQAVDDAVLVAQAGRVAATEISERPLPS
jgi:hypothetical protein